MNRFVAIEGTEGTGKSTQARLLAERLESEGYPVTLTREPGGTRFGEMIRKMLLGPEAGPLGARAEALLYAADRAIHVDEVIRPALERGEWVVTDRYSDSYRAYQGGGRQLGIAEVGEISNWASGGLEPDLVIVLDVDVEVGLARLDAKRDRIESEDVEFHRRVRKAFVDLAGSDPSRIRVVDASPPADVVSEMVWREVGRLRGDDA